MSEDRRIATEAFAAELRRKGLSVDVDVTEYVPGRRGLGPVEWTGIFIGTTVATSIISGITDDLYQKAKDFLRYRKKHKIGRPNTGFTIYGPNGEELRKWTTKEDDEAQS